MGDLVGQGEHLSRFCVRSVDKDERRQGIRKCKSAEFFGIKGPMCVAAHNATNHHQYAKRVSLVDEPAQSVCPREGLPSLVQVEP